MICRAVLGRVDDSATHVDWVDLLWPQTLRRALRLTSRAGRRVDVLLPPGGRLAHGDVLATNGQVVAVCVERIAVLAIDAADPVARGRLAFHLGNLHLPAQITATHVLTPDDGPAHAAAELFGLTFTRRVERFYPEPVTLNDFASGPLSRYPGGGLGRGSALPTTVPTNNTADPLPNPPPAYREREPEAAR